VWLAGGVLVLLALVPVEGFWRLRGHAPTVNDDAALWMLARSAVRPNDTSDVVLLGASRMQQGLDLDAFARVFGGRKPVQLAVTAATFMPVLNDLSADESFRGIAICDIMPFLFYPGGFATDASDAAGPSLASTPADYVRRFHNTTGFSGRFATPLLERRLRTLVQQTLVLRQAALVPTAGNLADWWDKRSLPPPSRRVMMPDRSEKADYRSLDAEVLERTKQWWVVRNRVLGAAAGPEEVQSGLNVLEHMVRRIQGRGGRVVFIAFPISGVIAEMEERNIPRSRYWDVLASYTSALTIHFRDYSELASFECLEGSHLDFRDATRFTEAFAKILRARLNETDGAAF
jgi:hypothetical protein